MESIGKTSVVEIRYVLKGDDGVVIDRSPEDEPFIFLMGVEGIVPGLERELIDRKVGDSFSVTIEPQDGYGEYDQKLVGEVPRSHFPFNATLVRGMKYQVEVAGGIQVFTLLGLEGEKVKIDANHDMAGKSLHFDVEVVSVREATEPEISHGHAHVKGHCQH